MMRKIFAIALVALAMLPLPAHAQVCNFGVNQFTPIFDTATGRVRYCNAGVITDASLAAAGIAAAGSNTQVMYNSSGALAGSSGFVWNNGTTTLTITGTVSATTLTGALATSNLTGTLAAAQFPALTGDVTTVAGALATTIGANRVTRAMQTQGIARSVVGVTGNATANVADIQGTANQVLRVDSAGTGLAFGAINLASSAAVTGNLPVANLGSGTGASATTFWRGDGTWAAPTFSSNVISQGDSNVTVTDAGTGSVTTAVDGVTRMTLAAGSITAAVPIIAAAGSATSPGVTLTGDTNTGLYSVADGTMGITVDGTQRATITGLAFTTTVPFLASAGSAGAPSHSFSGDPDTGMYSGGTNILTFATAANERVRIDASGNVGIGTVSPAARLHIINSTAASQLRLADNETNATAKYGVITAGHYTNAEEPVIIAGTQSDAGNNIIYFGGGFSTTNAATQLRFVTAANTTTVTGTTRMTIDSAGTVTIPGNLVVSGTCTGCGGGGGTPGGSNTQVQFNNSGAFGGSANFTWTTGTNTLAVTGTVSATTLTGALATTSLTGTLAAAQFPALTGDVTTVAGGLAATVARINGVALGSTTATGGNLLIGSGTQWVSTAVTGDVTISSAGVTAIAANAITRADMVQGIARSVIGVTGNATANVADIQGTANQVLRVDSAGTGLAFGAINLASSAAVTGNLPVANLGSGTGASATTFWRGDGTWATPAGGGGTPGGSNTQVQFNNSGAFGGSAGFVWDNTNRALTISRAAGAGSGIVFNATDGSRGIFINPHNTAGAWNPLGQTGDQMLLYTGGTIDTGALVIGPHSASNKGIRIDVNGNVGIGVSSPSSKLTVNGVIRSYVDFADIELVAANNAGFRWALDGSQNLLLQGTTNAFSSVSVTPISITAAGAVSVAGTLTAGTFSGSGASLTSLPAANLTGNLAVARFNSGTAASATTFWRGDGTWATPTLSTNVISQGDSNVTVTDAGTGVVTIQTDAVQRMAIGAADINLNGKNAFTTNDTYLRINQGSAFTAGTWFGSSNIMVSSGILALGSNGGTTTSRVYISGGTFDGNNVINLDGVTGTITATTFSGSGASLTNLPAANLTGNLAVARFNTGTGASAATFWRGDGTWAAPTAAPGGSDTHIQYNNSGAMAGISALTFNKNAASPILSLAGSSTAEFRLQGAGGMWRMNADNGTNLFRIFDNGSNNRFQIDAAGGITTSSSLYLGSTLNLADTLIMRGADPYIRRDVNNSHLVLSGGSGWTATGPTMVLYGASHAVNPGNILISAADTGNRVFTVAGFTGGIFLNTATTVTGTMTATTFSGSGASLTNLPAGNLTGNLAVARFNSGTSASATTFWRGDGTWATPTATVTPAGSNTQIQYNNSGALGASANLTWNQGTNTLGVGGPLNVSGATTLSSTLNVTGIISGNGKAIFNTGDTYLRINESAAFSAGTWFGATNVMIGGGGGSFSVGSNGGTTNSRVHIVSGTFNGTNVITLDGSNGNATFAGTVTVGAIANLNAAPDVWHNAGGGGRFYFASGNSVTYIKGGSATPIQFRNSADATIATISSSGELIAVGDMRAPIFYDQNDYGYYVNPNGQSNLWDVRGAIFYDIQNTGFYIDPNGSSNVATFTMGTAYSGNWFRSTGATGWYNETYAGGIYMTDTTYIRAQSGESLLFPGYFHTSDARLKHDVRKFVRDPFLTIKGLQAVHFKWNEDNKEDFGVIAQEVEKVLPEVVLKNVDAGGFMTVQYDKLVLPVIEAVKKLIDIAEDLQSKVASLLEFKSDAEKRFERIEKQLDALKAENAALKTELAKTKANSVPAR
jgi:hypothetical protein